MNPMIRKEFVSHMRERKSWVLLTLYLFILGAVVILTYHSLLDSGPRGGGEAGLAVFLATAFTQLALLLLLAPVFSAGRITIEKEQQTLASLLTTLLSPAQIWWGKYAASMLYLTLLLVSSLPILGLAFGLGGVGMEQVLKATAATFLVLASICSVSLLASCYFRHSVHATAIAYALVIILTVVTFILYAMTEGSFNSESSSILQQVLLNLNPFTGMTALLSEEQIPGASWIASMLFYTGVGFISAALGIRRLERLGAQA